MRRSAFLDNRGREVLLCFRNCMEYVPSPCFLTGLGLAMKHTHGRYASYWNTAHNSSGHLWQGGYYSCSLDPPHLWEALRYTELNPVRAGLVAEA